MTTSHVPNLDAEEPDALNAFWYRHQNGRAARELFPEGGAGTQRATADLACYAANIGAAKVCRLDGRIPDARSRRQPDVHTVCRRQRVPHAGPLVAA